MEPAPTDIPADLVFTTRFDGLDLLVIFGLMGAIILVFKILKYLCGQNEVNDLAGSNSIGTTATDEKKPGNPDVVVDLPEKMDNNRFAADDMISMPMHPPSYEEAIGKDLFHGQSTIDNSAK